MPDIGLLIKVGAFLCFAFEAWRAKSVIALGLALLTLALLFSEQKLYA